MAFGLSLAALDKAVPFVLVEPYAGMMCGQVRKYGFQGGRTELLRIGLYREPQGVAPFRSLVRNVAVLPVPRARRQVLFRVEERPASLYLHGSFLPECRALRVTQQITHPALVYLFGRGALLCTVQTAPQDMEAGRQRPLEGHGTVAHNGIVQWRGGCTHFVHQRRIGKPDSGLSGSLRLYAGCQQGEEDNR